jgi:spore germination protein YaaH
MSFRRFLHVLFVVCILVSCSSVPPESAKQIPPPEDEYEDVVKIPEGFDNLPVSVFDEVWAYVTSGNESELSSSQPISDAAYFSAGIDSYGKLAHVPSRKRLANYGGRVHLVLEGGSAVLTHFVLKPGSSERAQLIADLLKAAQGYDGLQIDFESVPGRDGENFWSFLAELRKGLKGKMFTIALPARTRTISGDVYDYAKILPLVDKIFVMAYDEHWSTSKPGPIASMDWCRQVADYALKTIGPDKLIMGLPLYGRIWGSERTSRALFFSGMERLRGDNGAKAQRENDIPMFTYQIPVTVTGYYEDEHSLAMRLDMYRDMGVKLVGFWRLGMETPLVWRLIKLASHR